MFERVEQEPIDWKTVYFKYKHDMTTADLSQDLHNFWRTAAAAAQSHATEKTAQAVRASSQERPARGGVVRSNQTAKKRHYCEISADPPQNDPTDSEVKARSKASKTLV
jgi:hypothetical protein